MGDLIKIHWGPDGPFVEGRVLHAALEPETPYHKWLPRQCEYGFIEGRDFRTKMSKSTGGRPAADHELSFHMAKEISMLPRTEIGKKVRQYFIQLEEAWNSPETLMARALQMADKQIKQMETTLLQITVQNQLMAPKAEYYDQCMDRDNLTSFRVTAKAFGISESTLIRFLQDRGFIYRDRGGKLMPYADSNKGYFEVKECFNQSNGWAGVQTLITAKGREKFWRMLFGDKDPTIIN
jgi:anti-repressor protein